MILQGGEYIKRKFRINSTVYGTVFFLLTGFHGFHVTIGIVLLIVCFFRLMLGHFKKNIHVGFEISA
jgi:cytochrome c oxidase subunit 3